MESYKIISINDEKGSKKMGKYIICEHRKWKHDCKECKVGYINMESGKKRHRESGTGICKHGKWRSKCKECGMRYCKHGKRKHYCKECGTGICEHGKWKNSYMFYHFIIIIIK